MIPMGLGMASVNAGVLFLSAKQMGTMFIDPIASGPEKLLDVLQIDFLQPIYTFTFSNGLIACLVFMGIGAISDIGYMLIAPMRCMFIALMAELGTILTFPIAVAMGLTYKEAAAIAMVGGADGPMVLYTSLILARDLFVPITIVAYLYLSLTYAGYPYLVRLLIPKHLRGIKMDLKTAPNVSPVQKITFAIVTCTLLCLLFPVAAPLFLSFFLGVVIRESGIKQYVEFLSGTVLYGSTFFLGLMLGVLFEANTILNPKVLLLLFLGLTALLLSGIGGIIGGYIVYWSSGRTFNPVIGIAGVSCVPTTAKVAQKEVHDANKFAMILPWAMGACVSGVITSAIITGLYVSVLQHTP
jgi:carboxybiotin decarboxylase